MIVCKKKESARRKVNEWKDKNLKVGIVPTMGALHPGHHSLIKASLKECDRTVVSIFLNPTQFGEDEDLEEYPRQHKDDMDLLEKIGVDVAFAPDAAEMYPEGFCTWVLQEKLTEKLCGALRPGHFQGVCTVVAKLFGIIPAQNAYFGRKDFQQAAVINRMVRDLDIPVNIRIMPTVREKDGLALSSRNRYLGEPERRQAACLHEALKAARKMFQNGVKDINELRKAMHDRLDEKNMVKPQYVEIVEPETLERPETATPDAVGAIAAFAGKTRLIDNMPLGGETGDVYLNDKEEIKYS